MATGVCSRAVKYEFLWDQLSINSLVSETKKALSCKTQSLDILKNI
jgi:hypothetical protein